MKLKILKEKENKTSNNNISDKSTNFLKLKKTKRKGNINLKTKLNEKMKK